MIGCTVDFKPLNIEHKIYCWNLIAKEIDLNRLLDVDFILQNLPKSMYT
jgi:hypothetical protein